MIAAMEREWNDYFQICVQPSQRNATHLWIGMNGAVSVCSTVIARLSIPGFYINKQFGRKDSKPTLCPQSQLGILSLAFLHRPSRTL